MSSNIRPTGKATRNTQASTSDMEEKNNSLPIDTHGMKSKGSTGKAAPRASLKDTFVSLVKETNLYAVLNTRADDAQFVERLKRTDLEKGGVTFNGVLKDVGKLQNHITQLKNDRHIDASLAKALTKDLKGVEEAVKIMSEGRDGRVRLVASMMNLLHAWPPLVPSPLLDNQLKTFAFTVCANINAIALVGSLGASPYCDGWPIPGTSGVMGEASNEAHLYPLLLNALFGVPAMLRKFAPEPLAGGADSVANSTFFHLGVGLAATGILMLPFFSSQVKAAGNTLATKGIQALEFLHVISPETGAAWRSPPTISPKIKEAVRNEVKLALESLELSADNMNMVRASFTGSPASGGEGKELTRALNAQFTKALTHMRNIVSELTKALPPDTSALESTSTCSVNPAGGNSPVEGSVERAASPGENKKNVNADFTAKMTLTVMAGLMAAATISMVLPEVIGTVDLTADGLVLTAAMAQGAMTPQFTKDQQMERLRNMASTTVVLVVALAADKFAQASGKFPDGLAQSSDSAPYYAAGILTAMVMLMAGPLAKGAAMGVGKLGEGLQWLTSCAKGQGANGENIEELADIIVDNLSDQLKADPSNESGTSDGHLARIETLSKRDPLAGRTPTDDQRTRGRQGSRSSASTGKSRLSGAGVGGVERLYDPLSVDSPKEPEPSKGLGAGIEWFPEPRRLALPISPDDEREARGRRRFSSSASTETSWLSGADVGGSDHSSRRSDESQRPPLNRWIDTSISKPPQNDDTRLPRTPVMTPPASPDRHDDSRPWGDQLCEIAEDILTEPQPLSPLTLPNEEAAGPETDTTKAAEAPDTPSVATAEKTRTVFHRKGPWNRKPTPGKTYLGGFVEKRPVPPADAKSDVASDNTADSTGTGDI